ncbi:MAG: ATP-binding protein [Pseudomonadota bacterium]
MQDRDKQPDRQIDGTLSLSVAVLCAVFVGLTLSCFLMVSVWLSVQQHTLRFERTVSDVSVAAMRMFHASNGFHSAGAFESVDATDHAGMGHQTHGGGRTKGSEHHKALMRAIRKFNKKAAKLRSYFKDATVAPSLNWGELTDYIVWASGAAEIPDQVQAVWEEEAAGYTISQMLKEQAKTCIHLCMSPDLSPEERKSALTRLNEIAVNSLQPQLSALLVATVNWQTENIQATRRGIAVAFGMLVIAVVTIWRGLIGPLLKRIARAKAQLSRQNGDLEKRVAERTETLSTALEIAKDAAEARTNFLANMSHELRTPMNGVLGMAALLSSTKLDEKQRTHVDTITKSGTLLLRIIDDVLDMSGLSAGKLQITLKEAVLADIVEDVVKLLYPVAEAKNLFLETDLLHAARMPILVDPQRMSQVLNNLIGNALKFTEKGGVCVCLQEAESAEGMLASISIQDTGIGIPKNELNRIFGQFERVRNGKVISGAGLGLAISRSLIQEMGGRIRVTSIVGKGSQFTVTLPLERSRALNQDLPGQIVAL